MRTAIKASVLGPEKIVVRWWKNAWKLKSPPRGLIFLLHGIGEHSARYDEFASFVCQWGFDVLTFDHPGHGLTSRKGNFSRFADFDEMKREAHSVLHFWRTEGPDAGAEYRLKPVFLMGHSMGALLLLYWLSSERGLEESPLNIQRAIASAPPIGLSLKVPYWKEVLSKLLHTTLPDLKLDNGIKAQGLSRDQVKNFDYTRDPWRTSKASPRLYRSMVSTMGYLREHSIQLQLPVLVMSGSADPIIHHGLLRDYYESLNTHKKWLSFNGMCHEILNEIGREMVFEEVLKWLLKN